MPRSLWTKFHSLMVSFEEKIFLLIKSSLSNVSLHGSCPWCPMALSHLVSFAQHCSWDWFITNCGSFTVTGAWPWQVHNAHYSPTLLVMTWGLSSAITNFTAMNSLIIVSRDTFPCISLGLSVQFSRSVLSDSLQPHGLHHASLPCPSPAPRACSNSCPSSPWVCDGHLILCRLLLLLLSIFPSVRVFSSESVLHIRWPKYWASASA